jgi:hypothetical protein
VTSPAPESSRSARALALSDSPFARRDSFGETPSAMSDYSPEAMSDDELPVTPTMAETMLRKVRRVGFAQAPQKTIFRYPAADHELGDEDWWWDGWEESEEDATQEDVRGALPLFEDPSSPEEERMGRPRLRRKEAFIA